MDTADQFGNKVSVSSLDVPPQVANATLAAFDGVVDNAASFWGPYDTARAARY